MCACGERVAGRDSKQAPGQAQKTVLGSRGPWVCDRSCCCSCSATWLLALGPHLSNCQSGTAGSGHPGVCRGGPLQGGRALGPGAGSAAAPAPGMSNGSSCSSHSTGTPLGTGWGHQQAPLWLPQPLPCTLPTHPCPGWDPAEDMGKRGPRVQKGPTGWTRSPGEEVRWQRA